MLDKSTEIIALRKCKNRRWLIVFILSLYSLKATVGHSQTVPYKNYGVKDGLPSSEVYNVMQDTKGYMWFCTDAGVCRFDGYEFKVFNSTNGLADNDVYEAIEDYKGRIWFRSLSGKLSYYYNDSIFKLPVNDTLIKILRRNQAQVISIFVDSSNIIYLGLQGYIYPIRINMENPPGISFIPVSPYHIDYIYMTPSGGIINGVYSKVDSAFIPFVSPLLVLYKVLPKENVTRISQYVTGTIESQIHNKALLAANGSILTSAYNRLIMLDSLHKMVFFNIRQGVILNIVPGKKNMAWVITDGMAPQLFDGSKLIDFPELQFLKTKRITSMKVDAEGGFWFSSLTEGVFYVKSLNFKIWTTDVGLPGNKITSITLAPNGSVYLCMFLSNKIAIINVDSVSKFPLPDSTGISLNSMLIHLDKRIWVTTSVGLFIFNDFNVLDKPIVMTSAFRGKKLLLNNDGSVWLQSKFILCKLERKGHSIVTDTILKLKHNIWTVCKDTSENLWIGTSNGLYEYSKNTRFLNYLSDSIPSLKQSINCVLITKKGDVWLGTPSEGIMVKSRQRIYHITSKDGLLSDFCKFICEDNLGNIWVGTRLGLSHIILDKKRNGYLNIRTIKNINSPYLTEINCIACRNNIVYVGTNAGLIQFDMNTILPDTIAPRVYITQVKVNNKNVHFNNTPLNLPYGENYILLNFVALKYTNSGKVNYRYKLSGIDTGWIYTTSTTVQYPKLQPGAYKFLVSAENDDGVWNNHPATFSFIIAPPIWATWWARTLYILAIAGIGYYWIRTIQLREKRKTEINKQLMAAELRELKSQFDPHFLFNSLNTLAHLVENKSDNAPDFVYELSKFYRYSLQFRENELMELDKEIKQAKSYIHLIKIRFGDQCKDEWSINEKYYSYFIPTYSLQLLVENAIKHNIINKEKPLTIEISTTDDANLVVKNKLQPRITDVASTGHGLESINERYVLLTGKKITITKTSDYFCVALPLIPGNHESINS